MMKQKYAFEKNMFMALAMLLACILFISSCKSDDDIPDGPKDDVNTWIEKTMRDHYLWYDEIPATSKLNHTDDPDKFFSSLLSDKDGQPSKGLLHFSTIEKDKSSSKAITDASNSYGFEFASLKDKATGNYFLWVLYVLPGSPAADAGLKRGEWIIAVNSQNPNIKDYSILLKGNKAVFSLARYDGVEDTWIPTRLLDMPASRAVNDVPILKDSVYQIGSSRIGYMMYNHFSSGPDGDKSQMYNTQMQQLFSKLKSQNVNEFVLDLRYNGGGLVSCAQLLTSYLAPSGVLGKTFCVMENNDKHQKTNTELFLKKNSDLSGDNLSLKRLYVLVSEYTASASEAVINCLIPYIGRQNIILIGEQTVGKLVGSKPYGETEGYGWLLHPIVFRIYNADHKADYADGFAPDHKLSELIVGNELLPFGDTNELMLKKAISLITGQQGVKASVQSERISTEFDYISFSNKKTNGLLYQPQE